MKFYDRLIWWSNDFKFATMGFGKKYCRSLMDHKMILIVEKPQGGSEERVDALLDAVHVQLDDRLQEKRPGDHCERQHKFCRL